MDTALHPIAPVRRRRPSTARRVLAWLLAAAIAAPVSFAQPAITTREAFEKKREEMRRDMERRFESSRPSVQTRRGRGGSDDGVLAYRTRSGGIVLTNRPQRYQNRANYSDTRTRSQIQRAYRPLPGNQQQRMSQIAEIVTQYAQLHALDEALVYAVIRVESNFNAAAVSRAGARGLMQLMPGTASDLGVSNTFDPKQNISGGTRYLAMMLREFGGDIDLALAGYNAGPEAVRKYNGIPPYQETQNHVRLVKRWWNHYRVHGVTNAHLAKMDEAVAQPTVPTVLEAKDRGGYLVHFVSGLSQPADAIVDDDPYYYITFQGQTRRIRKDRVKEVAEAAA